MYALTPTLYFTFMLTVLISCFPIGQKTEQVISFRSGSKGALIQCYRIKTQILKSLPHLPIDAVSDKLKQGNISLTYFDTCVDIFVKALH